MLVRRGRLGRAVEGQLLGRNLLGPLGRPPGRFLAPLGRPPGRLVGVLLRLLLHRLLLLHSRRIHHGERRARRSGRRLLRGGRPRVHGDRELDRAAEFARQRVNDERTEPGFQLLLHERIRRGDQNGILDQAERPGELGLEPGELAGPDVHLGEPLKGSCPYLRQIQIAHRCAPLTSPATPDLRSCQPLTASRCPQVRPQGVYVRCTAVSPAPWRQLAPTGSACER